MEKPRWYQTVLRGAVYVKCRSGRGDGWKHCGEADETVELESRKRPSHCKHSILSVSVSWWFRRVFFFLPHSAVLVLSLWWNRKCQNGGERRCRRCTPDAVSGLQCCECHKQGGGVVDVWRRIEQPGRKSEALLEYIQWIVLTLYYSTFWFTAGARVSSRDHYMIFRAPFMKCEHRFG